MKFRSKPKEIEAVQFFPEKEPWPPDVFFDVDSETGFSVLNEVHNIASKIKAGDWIRVDMPGDRYPITDESLRANYEPVE